MAVGSITIPSVMDMYDTREMFSRYYVDPVIAKQHVPSGRSSFMKTEGRFCMFWCRNAIRWFWIKYST